MNGTIGTGKYELLLEKCRDLAPVPTAVAHPCEESALAGAIEAGEKGLITPILVGPAAKIRGGRAGCRDRSRARSGSSMPPHSHAAAAKAVELVRKGEAELLMKGSLHTDELLGAVVAQGDGPAHGPPHQPRVHHGRADLPQGAGVTDAAINIAPDPGGQGRHLPERHRPGDCRSASRRRRSRSSRPSRPSPRRCRPRSMPPPSARWPSAGRSRAACWTARWPSTTRSARTPRGSRASTPRSPAIPTSCSRPTSRRATSWPSSSASWPTRTARAWCSAPGCRSS